ncbi:IPT/TIG domain-containing protein [Streptomyces sp. NPDC048516]|uniref:IPT/TIG domain-containing protein n=1 Tax=Streptomyces sp. NPDC048516 TaxID=3365565 RepID=UPI0037230B34
MIDTASHAVVENIGVGDGPTGIAVFPDGTHAYVTNSGAGTVGVMAATVIPDQGRTAGGAVVTLTGTGLSSTDQVTFHGVLAPFEIVSDTMLTAASPPSGTPGTFDVTASCPGGMPSGSFTYVSGPDI